MTSIPPSVPSSSTPTPALDRFFAALRRATVTRSSDHVIAGVCAGIAHRLGVAPAIVRVGAVVLALLGPGVFLYLAAWLMLPGPDGRIRLERAVRDGQASSIVLLVLTVVALFGDLAGHAHLGPAPFIALGVLAVVGAKRGWFGSGHQGGRNGGRNGHCSGSSSGTAAAPAAGYQSPSAYPQDAPRS